MKQMQNMYISTTIIYTNDKIQISVFETFKRQFCLKFCYNPVRSSSLFFKASWLLKVQHRWKTSTTNDTKSENNLFSGTFHRNQIQAETHWKSCCDIILFQISACHCYNSNQPVITCRNRVQNSSNWRMHQPWALVHNLKLCWAGTEVIKCHERWKKQKEWMERAGESRS